MPVIHRADCGSLHRLPPPAESMPDTTRDVFNREKHADYKDDMSGNGSFSRINRTLYIGRIKENRNTAEMVERHFEEFGEIERSESEPHPQLTVQALELTPDGSGPVKILQSRGVAFVTYFSELNAQFAKEAMTDQSLDSEEIINVRYAVSPPLASLHPRGHRPLAPAPLT